jgi:hypothetical protein
MLQLQIVRCASTECNLKRHAPSLPLQNLQPGSAPPATSSAATLYKLKWLIPNELIDNVRGVERTFRVSIEYRKPCVVGQLKLKLPLRRGMRTDDAEAHQALIYRLNQHLGHEQVRIRQGFLLIAFPEIRMNSEVYEARQTLGFLLVAFPDHNE